MRKFSFPVLFHSWHGNERVLCARLDSFNTAHRNRLALGHAYSRGEGVHVVFEVQFMFVSFAL